MGSTATTSNAVLAVQIERAGFNLDVAGHEVGADVKITSISHSLHESLVELWTGSHGTCRIRGRVPAVVPLRCNL